MAADAGNNLAVPIDADNVSAKVIGGLMEEVANYGTASVRRLYGDLTSPNMKSWRGTLLKHSIQPIQQFAYTTGKNATDGAMIIDAMDLLYTGRFSGFCLVSSDSDFTRLASRIREHGVPVHGFGERKTPSAFISACSKFVFFDVLPTPSEEAVDEPVLVETKSIDHGALPYRPGPSVPIGTPTGPRAAPRRLDQNTLDALRRAIIASSPYEDDWVNLAELGRILVRMAPELNARNYGYDRLWDFVEASGVVEMRKKSRPPASPYCIGSLEITMRGLPAYMNNGGTRAYPAYRFGSIHLSIRRRLRTKKVILT